MSVVFVYVHVCLCMRVTSVLMCTCVRVRGSKHLHWPLDAAAQGHGPLGAAGEHGDVGWQAAHPLAQLLIHGVELVTEDPVHLRHL